MAYKLRFKRSVARDLKQLERRDQKRVLAKIEKELVARRQALEIIGHHLELNPDDARALYFGAGALIKLGERERGLEWASRALAIDPEDTAVLYNVACAHSLSGEIEKAIDYLEKATKAGFAHRGWIENDSDLDPLRSHPWFQALLAGMK